MSKTQKYSIAQDILLKAKYDFQFWDYFPLKKFQFYLKYRLLLLENCYCVLLQIFWLLISMPVVWFQRFQFAWLFSPICQLFRSYNRQFWFANIRHWFFHFYLHVYRSKISKEIKVRNLFIYIWLNMPCFCFSFL